MILQDYVFDEDDPKSLLGRGAFGCVYRGCHRTTKDAVAVKKIPASAANCEELATVRQMRCSNVVHIIDLVVVDGFYHIVMELCDGDLQSYLQRGPLSEQDFITVARSLAVGYKALYDHNIIHRDIKPGNILLKCDKRADDPGNGTDDGDRPNTRLVAIRAAKIADFGSSRLTEDKVRSNLIGTPLYMAPEIGANILMNVEYDFKVDMWSIGVVLYECLAGKVPFNESALCRLFLFAANHNYDGFQGPPPIPGAVEWQTFVVESLLQLNASKRMTPPQFYCIVIHSLSDGGQETADSEEPDNDQKAKSHAGLLSRGALGQCKLCCSNTDERRSRSYVLSMVECVLFYAGLYIACSYCCLYTGEVFFQPL